MLTTFQLLIACFAIIGIIIPFIVLNLISLYRYLNRPTIASNDMRVFWRELGDNLSIDTFKRF